MWLQMTITLLLLYNVICKQKEIGNAKVHVRENSYEKCIDHFKKSILPNVNDNSLYMITLDKNQKYALVEMKYALQNNAFTKIHNLTFKNNDHRAIKSEEIGTEGQFTTYLMRVETNNFDPATYFSGQIGFNMCPNGNIFSCKAKKAGYSDNYSHYKSILDRRQFDKYFKAAVTGFHAAENKTKIYNIVYPSKPFHGGAFMDAHPWDVKYLHGKGVLRDGKNNANRMLFQKVNDTDNKCARDEVLVEVVIQQNGQPQYCHWEKELAIFRKYPQINLFYNPETGKGSTKPPSRDYYVRMDHMSTSYRYSDMNGLDDIINAFVLYPSTAGTTTQKIVTTGTTQASTTNDGHLIVLESMKIPSTTKETPLNEKKEAKDTTTQVLVNSVSTEAPTTTLATKELLDTTKENPFNLQQKKEAKEDIPSEGDDKSKMSYEMKKTVDMIMYALDHPEALNDTKRDGINIDTFDKF